MATRSTAYASAYQRHRKSLLTRNRHTNGGLCHYCWAREATVADHQPPLSEFFDYRDWEGELVPSCKPCSDSQGGRIGSARRRRRRTVNRQSRDWLSA